MVYRVIYRPAFGAGVLPGWNAMIGSSKAVPGCHFGILRNSSLNKYLLNTDYGPGAVWGEEQSLMFSAPGKRYRVPEMVTSFSGLGSVCEHLLSQNILWRNTFQGEYYRSWLNKY